MNKPGLFTGAFVGGLTTLPLIAVLALSAQILGTPFFPFDLFDWVARALPGPVITFGIDSMVGIIRGLNLGPTDQTAKLAEQALALALFVVIGALAGAIFFALMRRARSTAQGITPGLLLGLITGLPVVLIALSVNINALADPLVSLIWGMALYLVWGAAVAWIYRRLARGAAAAPGATGASAASVEPIDRRQFLITVGATSALITVVGAGLSALLARRDEPVSESLAVAENSQPSAALPNLPNAEDPVQPAPGTRPELTDIEDHYRIDINLTPPTVAEEGYVLPFVVTSADGSLTTLKQLTLDEIRNGYEPTHAYITMSCISNPIGGDLISTTRWTGVPMARILADIERPADATHLKITGADGFDETVALDMIDADERIMLTYAWDDKPLLVRNGFPLRIHIPDLYGMKQPKWITQVEFISGDQDGYWVRRGWDKVAQARATSVIDTVATDAIVTTDDGVQLIPIGGIAWAGARGISKVEVRVDNGEWQEAQLRAPISERTWTIWRYDWPFAEGSHTFEVRCQEGDGTPQIEQIDGVRPSGATGIHLLSERV
jgi:DMSO/TMAO reductase YedYZ molybdopterin-dependent catalytic subunit